MGVRCIAGQMPVRRDAGRGSMTLAARAMAVLAKYGSSAHMWLPGVGYVNGINCKNFKDGALLATGVDDVVGYVGDAAQGTGLVAQNTTTAQKPFLRRGAVNYAVASEMTGAALGVIGSGGSLPAGWTIGPCAGITSSVAGLGTLPDGAKYIDIRIFGTNTSGAQTPLDLMFGSMPAIQGVNATLSLRYAVLSAVNISGFTPSTREFGLLELTSASGYVTVGTGVAEGGTIDTVKSYSRAITGATTAKVTAFIKNTVVIGGTVDITFRVAQPMLQQGAVATAYVGTTGATPKSAPSGGLYWELDGADDMFNLPGATHQLADSWFVAAASRPRVTSGYRSIIVPASNSATTARLGAIGIEPGGNLFVYGSTDAGVTFNNVIGVVAAEEKFIASAWSDGTTMFGRKNSNSVVSVALGAPPVTLNAGAIGKGIGFAAFYGSVYGGIVIKAATTAADRLTLNKFLGSLAGVTL